MGEKTVEKFHQEKKIHRLKILNKKIEISIMNQLFNLLMLQFQYSRFAKINSAHPQYYQVLCKKKVPKCNFSTPRHHYIYCAKSVSRSIIVHYVSRIEIEREIFEMYL